jgi:hypothetical protein
MDRKIVPHFWLAVGGVALAFLGLIGPWAKVTSFISLSITGFEVPDGKYLAFGAAAVALFLGVYALRERRARLLIGSGIVGAVIAGDALYYVARLGEVDGGNDVALVSIGWGLYATVAGGAMIALGSVLTLTESRKQRRAATAAMPVAPPVQP